MEWEMLPVSLDLVGGEKHTESCLLHSHLAINCNHTQLHRSPKKTGVGARLVKFHCECDCCRQFGSPKPVDAWLGAGDRAGQCGVPSRLLPGLARGSQGAAAILSLSFSSSPASPSSSNSPASPHQPAYVALAAICRNRWEVQRCMLQRGAAQECLVMATSFCMASTGGWHPQPCQLLASCRPDPVRSW